MKKTVLGALLLGVTVSFAGCGGDTASIDEGYSKSKPREPGSGPVGITGGGAAAKQDDSSVSAPPPPPL